MTVRVDLLPGDAAREHRGEIEAVCAEAFAAAPYFRTAEGNAATFRRFDAQTRKSGFLLAAGHCGDQLLGLAYGYPLGPETGWWHDVLEPVPDALTVEDGRRSFAIFEFAVRPAWQRQGVGRAVHARLSRALHNERVILNCRADAEAAQAFYRALGYRRASSVLPPWAGGAVYDVMLLDLAR